jgi:GNAT superfamily N-acetyltransferase
MDSEARAAPMMATIRDYRAGDDARIWEILKAALAVYGLVSQPESTDQDLLNILGSYFSSGGIFRVLEIDDRLVGTYGLHNEGDGVAELRKMYLDPVYKGRGLGNMLLEDVLITARQLRFRAVNLESNSNLVEAAALYRKFGFVDMDREHMASRCDYALRLDL